VKQAGVHKAIWVTGALLGVFCGVRHAVSGPIQVNAVFDYAERHDTEENKTTTTFRKTAQFSTSNDISVTDTIRISPSFRVSQDADRDSDSLAVDPNLGLTMDTDLFSVTGSYLTNTRDDDDQSSRSESWDVNWQSRFKQNWPSLRFSYGGATSEVEDETQSESNFATINFDKDIDLSFLDLSYRFNRNMNWEHINEQESTNDTHEIDLGTSRSFLDNALHFAFNHQTTYSTRELSAPAGTQLEIEASLDDGRAGIDDSPESDLDDPLVETGDLINGGAEVDISTDENMNLAFSVSFVENRSINLIVLNLAPNVTVELEDQNQFLFEVWVSDTERFGFERVRLAAPADYVRDFRGGTTQDRFEISTAANITSRFVKVVVTGVPSSRPESAVLVSQIRAIERRVATGEDIESTTTTHKSSASLDALLAANWRLSTSFTHDLQINESNSGGSEGGESEDDEREKTDLGQNVSLYWSASRYFRPVLAFNQSLTTEDITNDKETDLNRAYSLRIGSQPLDTLDLSTSFTRTDTFRDSVQENTIDSFYFSADTQIFPDLSASLTGSLSQSQNLETGTASDALNLDLTTNLRATPRLTFDISLGYSEAGDEDSDPFEYRVAASWRPSDVFTVNSDVTIGEELGYSLSPLWRPSRNLQLLTTYRYDEETGNSILLQPKWLINDHLTFDIRYRWEELEWQWNARLTADF